MKLLFKSKDGGTESNVTGYWLIEAKGLFSVVLLRFDKGSREAFHSHAFNALSWVLKGQLLEIVKDSPDESRYLEPSVLPVFTARERFHQVFGMANETWVFSFRGPWTKQWKEYLPKKDKYVTLTNGRIVVDE